MAQYKITIDTKGQTKKQKQQDTISKVTNKSSSDQSLEDKVKKLKSNEAVKQTVNMAKTAVNIGLTYAQTVGVRTDNQARQNEINNVISVANTAINTAGGVAGSVAAGVAVGGAAGWIGAALAIITQLVSQGFGMYQNMLEISREYTKDKLDAYHNSERIGNLSTDKNRNR